MNVRPYMKEDWFKLLQSRLTGAIHAQQAKLLGISPTTLSMVLNGTGPYGDGTASTVRVANKVVHTFGRYACPHLSAESGGTEVIVSADQCRAYAHCPPPTGSPRAMQHWQACRHCPHREASAPPAERIPVPRKTPRTPPPSSLQEVPREAL